MKDGLEFLKHAGTQEVFQVMNNFPQYPFFFLIELLWSCHVVKKSISTKKSENDSMLNRILQLMLCFLVSLVMTFAGRELSAQVFHKTSPISSKPILIPIFCGVYALMFLTPYDIFFKISSLLYYFTALFQGINEMRIFLRIIEWSKTKDFIYTNTSFGLYFGILIVEFKYIVELCMRKFYHGKRTSITTFWQITKNALIVFTYYIAINYGEISKENRNLKIPEILMGLAMGILNASAILSD